ncbi:hypothetical protein F0562_033601 [Nyssa sinensis]|uniref:RING-type domain-containing protein n=1 Tax=Nyssa sinensis TaxID=561372 RepID=A0A5J5AIF3_9ASTE|nr:hypothetical protein F0562_033601 [Nyssa sinensis]
MENSKVGSDEAKTATPNLNDENPNDTATVGGGGGGSNLVNQSLQSSRTPFTHLSQVDADLALARTLQEQERAYMMLRMNRDGSDYGSWETGSYVHEDDGDFDDHSEDGYDGTEADGEDDDEDLALAGINDREAEDTDDHSGNSQSQDTLEEVDPDELLYEELVAVGEVVGTESRGLSADSIASLPSMNYKTLSTRDGSSDSCVICRLDYEDGDTLTKLSCNHLYHTECINNWLQINKTEMSPRGSNSFLNKREKNYCRADGTKLLGR